MNLTKSSERILTIVLLLVISFVTVALTTGAAYRGEMKGTEVKTVARVELERYAGKYYEIATIPSWFQKKCLGGVTATYTAKADGTIEVINRCHTADGVTQVKGEAWVVDAETNAKLKVSFSKYLKKLFSGDYWILGLDPDYRWAVVGHPSQKYGWILSRTPTLEEADLERVKQILTEQGYDFDRFAMTNQQDYPD